MRAANAAHTLRLWLTAPTHPEQSKELGSQPPHFDGAENVLARAAARIAAQVTNLVLALPLAAGNLQPTAPAP